MLRTQCNVDVRKVCMKTTKGDLVISLVQSCHLSATYCYLFTYLFDNENNKESNKWDNGLCWWLLKLAHLLPHFSLLLIGHLFGIQLWSKPWTFFFTSVVLFFPAVPFSHCCCPLIPSLFLPQLVPPLLLIMAKTTKVRSPPKASSRGKKTRQHQKSAALAMVKSEASNKSIINPLTLKVPACIV